MTLATKSHSSAVITCSLRLTRLKISDRWRERVSLLIEYGSDKKQKHGAASCSLIALVRCSVLSLFSPSKLSE